MTVKQPSPALFRLAVFLLLAGLLACTSVKLQENIEDYDDEIKELNARLRNNPQDADALRDLGALYFQAREYDDARIYLQKAAKINLQDPKTLFYLGMSLEFDGEEDRALRLYSMYSKVPRTSAYRGMMEGRFHWITREVARREAAELVKSSLADSSFIGSTANGALAVFPMLYRGEDPQYAPLGVGLSEMIIIDLGRISSLTMVERIRIQEVLKELDFAQKKYTDPATSPRTGQLLGASRIVSGVFNVLRAEQLLVDASSWDLTLRREPSIINRENPLPQLFELQKEVVFAIIEQLGLQPTPAERDAIMLVPTRNIKAFLEYCKGLEREDAGDFGAAANYYEAALVLDPNFELARQKSEKVRSIGAAGGTKEEAADFAAAINSLDAGKTGSGVPGKGDPGELIGGRIGRLGGNVGSTFVPGEDGRKPVEEIIGTGISTLPEPPPPPDPPAGR